MSNHVQSELASRYLARAGFFWRRIKDSRFKDWQKVARNTIFLPSVLTPAVEKQLKTERDIDQVFDLLAILRDESKRVEFLEELFKFRLREKV